ncbi:MAG: hypothetical protein JRN11_07360 [Nitrososphaerota archaeon]|nr:hypothetical protein [Nitrososphaerota archaeon]
MSRARKNPTKVLRVQSLWVFDDELNTIGRKSRWLSAHASQPIGRPLHRHAGYIEVREKESITFHERDGSLEIPLSTIRKATVGYDENFTRLAGGRGLIPPMHFAFEDRIVYFFTRDATDWVFRGKNERLLSMITGHPP